MQTLKTLNDKKIRYESGTDDAFHEGDPGYLYVTKKNKKKKYGFENFIF